MTLLLFILVYKIINTTKTLFQNQPMHLSFNITVFSKPLSSCCTCVEGSDNETLVVSLTFRRKREEKISQKIYNNMKHFQGPN